MQHIYDLSFKNGSFQGIQIKVTSKIMSFSDFPYRPGWECMRLHTHVPAHVILKACVVYCMPKTLYDGSFYIK